MADDLEKRITAKMVLDSTGFNDQLVGVNQQLKLTQSELKNASAQVGVFGENSESLKSVQEALAQQIELQAKKVDIYRQSIEKVSTKIQENISERDRLKTALDQEKSKYDEVIKLYGKESEEAEKAKKSVDDLTEQYNKKEKAVESNAKSINNYTTNMNKAEAELTIMQGELNKTTNELNKHNNSWIQASDTLRSSSEKLKTVGEGATNAGNEILGFTAPLIAAGVASSKFAMGYESDIAKVSTISDDAQVPIQDLSNQILKLSDDTGIASTEIADNVYDAISAGQQTGDAVNFVTNSTKLAKAGFAEAGQSLDVLTTILNAYGMKSSEVTNVSDLLIQVQNKGKVTVGELSSVMGKVIPTAVATNTSLQQLGASYTIMTSKGIDAAESTTYINSMLNELSKTGTEADKALREVSGKSFADLMNSGKSLGDVLNLLGDYAKKNKLNLQDMFGSAEAGKAALVLSTNAGQDFNNTLKDMNNVAGATDEAFKKVNDTTEARLNKSLNELKNNAIKVGTSLLPVIEQGSSLIGNLASALGKMDESQLKVLTDVVLFGAGLGGVLKVGGSVVSTVGGIVGVIGKLSSAMGTATIATESVGTAATVAAGAGGVGGVAGLGTALGGLAVAAAPWLVAGAAVAGVGYTIYKGMNEQAVPAVNLFADKVNKTSTQIMTAHGVMTTQIESDTVKISDATQKAVGAYIKMDDDVTKTLTELYINGTQITTDTANSLISKYNDMGTQIKSGMDKHYNDEYGIMNSFFEKSGALTDKEENDALINLKKNNDDKKKQIDDYEKQILTIMQSASKDHRELTSTEQQEINSIQDKMKSNAIQSLSQNEIEAKVIMDRMKAYGTRITSEQASEIIKNAEKQRIGSVDSANRQYEETKAEIEKMRDDTHSITSDQADKLIADAERQRDDSIKHADKLKEGVVEKITNMNKDVKDNVDTTSGEILTVWDKLKNWWDSWTPGVKNFIANLQVQPSGGKINGNWAGNNYYQGGLTALHEKGYEVYDLPRSTRIYNHDASEDLVKQTAESVATKVANSVLSSFNGDKNGISVTQNIYAPVSTPSEIARQTKNNLRELALQW